MDEIAVEQLRSLFEADLLEHPIEMGAAMGLSDRTRKRWVVFDVDGTVKATRHRALVSAPTHPQLKRRSENACAPGYGGRKRGDHARTRSTVACAHTHEWIGTFAAPGNGTPKPDPARACDLVERYLQAQGLTIVDVIVRLDGLYGGASYVSPVQQAKIAYAIRCRDYHLLNDPIVEAALAQAPHATIAYPDSPHARELFDIPCLDSTRRGYHEPMRLVIVRMERFDKRKRAVGKCKGKYIYELFLTSLPVEQFGMESTRLCSGAIWHLLRKSFNPEKEFTLLDGYQVLLMNQDCLLLVYQGKEPETLTDRAFYFQFAPECMFVNSTPKSYEPACHRAAIISPKHLLPLGPPPNATARQSGASQSVGYTRG